MNNPFTKSIAASLALALFACGGSQVAPGITVQPANATVAAGGNATFTVTATGGALQYQWSLAGAPISGATGGSYTTPAATATSRTALLNVVASPALTTQPKAVTQLAGTSATFSVAVAAGETLTWQWQKDGADIPSATAASYTIPSVSAANAGSYRCVVT